jgi:hypothetical protein
MARIHLKVDSQQPSAHPAPKHDVAIADPDDADSVRMILSGRFCPAATR